MVKMLGVVWLAGLVGLVGCAPPTRPASEAVAEEVERLRGLIESASLEEESWARVKSSVSRRLKEIDRDLAEGRLLLGLHDLAATRNTLLAYLYSQELAATATDGRERFEAEWARTATDLARGDAALPDPLPAAVRALAEAALVRTRPYHSASRGFALATDAKDGLFYLGRARAHADFVEFTRSLAFEPAGAPLRVRSPARELGRLEDHVLEIYRPPLSIDRHGDFIGLNATLKLARELDREGLHSGALHEYLEAVLRLGTIERDPPDEAEAARHRELAAQLEERLSAGGRDDSIGRLFLEMAFAAFPAPDGRLPDRDDLLRAAAVVERVLPAYFEFLESGPAPEAVGEPAVTVTLVRWPYT